MARHGARNRVKAIPLWAKLLVGIGAFAAVCVGLAFVPTDQVAYAPAEPIDLAGTITIDGRAAGPLQGTLDLVGVTERRVNLLQRLLLDVADPAIDFGPDPEKPSSSGPASGKVDSMSEAKQVAAAVALDLARPGSVTWSGTGATVEQLVPGTPAAAQLERGDIVVAVDGKTGSLVDTSVEASRLIEAHAPGSVVTIGVQRAGNPIQVKLRAVAPEPGDGDRASRIGAALSTIGLRISLNRDVGIDSGDVVGPSAGLPFALYLFDSLQPTDLLRGRHVVATGALAPDGQVLEVGRIRQMTIAAQAANSDLLLVPRENAAGARAAAARACGDSTSCLSVVAVRSVAEAIAVLELDDAGLAARSVSQGLP